MLGANTYLLGITRGKVRGEKTRRPLAGRFNIWSPPAARPSTKTLLKKLFLLAQHCLPSSTQQPTSSTSSFLAFITDRKKLFSHRIKVGLWAPTAHRLMVSLRASSRSRRSAVLMSVRLCLQPWILTDQLKRPKTVNASLNHMN